MTRNPLGLPPAAAFDPGIGAASLLLLLACLLLGLGLRRPLARWTARRRERAREIQLSLGLSRPVPGSVWGGPVAGLLTLALLSRMGAWPLGLVAGVVLWRVVDGLPSLRIRRERKKLDAQLVDGFVGIAGSLRAGLSLPRSVEQVAKDAPRPLKHELDRILQDYGRGKPIEQAMADARDRMDSRIYDLAVQAFRVGMQRGGNIAQVFDKISASIREIWRLEEHIRTVTTEGRSTARFMTLMPAAFLVLLFFLDADGAMLLFTDPVGITVLGIALLLNLLCNLWIRRILDVDV